MHGGCRYSKDKVAAVDLFAEISSYVHKETFCAKRSSAAKLNSIHDDELGTYYVPFLMEA